MRTQGILIALAMIASLSLAGTAGVADTGHAVKVTATAGFQDDCPDGDTRCWLIEKDGSLDAGATVNVTVVVPDDADTEHDFYVADSGFDEGGNSDPGTAIAGTDGTLAPGETASFEFTIPDDASELYAWCDVGAHEQLGMYKLWSFGGDGGDSGADGGSSDTAGDDGQQSSPGLGLIAALAGMSLAAFAIGRRR